MIIHAVAIANLVELAIVMNLEKALGLGVRRSTDTKRAGLGITFALDHQLLGGSGSLSMMIDRRYDCPLITRTPTPSSSDALRHTANTIEPARITASFSMVQRAERTPRVR